MDARVQRRVQRYGWDLAASTYEPLWQAQLAPAHDALLSMAHLREGETVLDVACGTGLVSFKAARHVGASGRVTGVDISGDMVAMAQSIALEQGVGNISFLRADAENLDIGKTGFDVVLCALGLMYVPDPAQALREMRRLLNPGGRIVIAVWGERASCGWASVFPIVNDEVSSDVCPMFFQMGQGDTLARLATGLRFGHVALQRISTCLDYANADEACQAAFVGGPAALAWSRFSDAVRVRVCERYVEAIETFRRGDGYKVPGEFVIVAGVAA